MGTKLDFKVKKGIDVEGGDITVASGNVVYAPTFDTNVAAAGVTLSGTTLQADGTDTNINIAITPKGSGEVDITKVDIDGGTIDGTTIATSDITVGSGKTLDVSSGTLTLANDQISGDKVSGGTIGTTTITALAGHLSLGDNNITNVGDISADSISADDASLGLTIDMSDGVTQSNKILLKDNLADALNITESANPYMKFRTVNTQERIEIFKDVEFSNARNHVLDVEAQTASNTGGKNITIGAGEGTGTQDGGQLIFESTGSGGSSGTNPTTRATAMTIFPSGTVQIPYVDINDGTIDGATIGANSATTGKFTNLTTTSWAKINGTARETNSMLQVNGPALSGSSDDTTMNYAEARIHTDIANDDVSGTTYNGLGNALVLDNAENIHVGQATIYTQGRSGTGNSWAIGRQANRAGASSEAAANIFHIGYFAQDYDNTANTTNNPLNVSNYLMTLDTSGTAKFKGDIILDDGGSLKEAGGTAALTFDASGNITKIGQDSPSDTHVLTWDNSAGYAVWSASASGADGMGSGFVLEDGDGTEVTIDENKEVKFIDGDGILINWTDTSTGSDGDPYDLTFSLNIDGMTDIGAGVVSGDLLIIDDGANGTNRKTTVDRIATAFAGDGLTASGTSLTVNADQSSIITAVGTLTGLTVSGAADLNNNLTVDGATISLDATTSLNIDNSNTSNGITIGTATSGVPISIGHTTSQTTINDNLTVTGDLTVNGTTTTVNSTTLEVDDKNIELGTVASPSDTTADGGGITLKGTTDKTIIWDNTNSNWTSNQDFNIASGKKFRINNTAVFESNTELTSTVVTSGLTTVGALNSGSITSGFGTINTGSSTITTSGTLTGGAIVGTSLAVSGTITGDTSLTLDSTTLTTAELGVLDGLTVGTVAASKALTVDANRDIATIRNLTSDGALEADGLQLTGGANSAADSATVVAIMDVSEATGQSWTGSTAYDIANYAYGTYRTAKFIVQVSDGTDTDCMEVLVTYEGASAPLDSTKIFLTTYAYVTTAASDLGTIDAVKNGSDETIDLQFTPTSTGTYSYSVVNTLLIK